jgi:hypothetical protein
MSVYRDSQTGMRMTAPMRLDGAIVFEPDDLHAMGVAFENVCSAIPTSLQTKELREAVARGIVMHASGGNRDSVDLYLACLASLRAAGRIPL